MAGTCLLALRSFVLSYGVYWLLAFQEGGDGN